MYLNRSSRKLVNTLLASIRKMSERRRQQNGDFSPSAATLHVLGSGARGSPACVYFFTDNGRYLFNCGEGTQRLAHEHKLKLARLEHVFLTSAKWDAIGGLPGTALTLQDVGIKKLTLHGPPGLGDLFVATQKFVVLNKLKIDTADCVANSTYSDPTMSVKYVHLKSNNAVKTLNTEINNQELKNLGVETDDTDYYAHEIIDKVHIRNSEMKELLLSEKKEAEYAISYICRLKPKLGVLDLQKCVNLGVKPGPLLGILKNGNDITLPDGTLVLSKDVKTPDDPGPVFMVVDVPDASYLDSLLESNEFKMHQDANNLGNVPSVIIHFTPSDILKTDKYQSFINSFPTKTSHLLINEENDCYGSVAIHRTQYLLNLLNDDIFPIICKDDIKSNDSNEINNDSDRVKIEGSKTLTMYRIRPETGLDRSSEVKLNVSEFIEEPQQIPEFEESLANLHNTIINVSDISPQEEYPKIVFFGTGSCIPNKTRNTSGIMLHIDENHSILLDCGEGTFGQMLRFYGKSQIDRILYNMKGVYISHLHADHHIGLVNILLQRKRALEKLGNTRSSNTDKLILLAPNQIMPWLCLYDRRFEQILQEFTLVPNYQLMKCNRDNISREFLSQLNVSDVETCGVKHCPNAFGVSIVTNDTKKITYSGDTMPCFNLIELGKGSDILIHEATMEDDLEEEARRKFHSTLQQATSVAQDMKAKHTILTHFSQRYARVPRISPDLENTFKKNNIGIAFDNMQIAYKNLAILPYLYPTLKLLFAEHCEILESKAAKRAFKREREQSPQNIKQTMTKKQLDAYKEKAAETTL